jgi:parallel beta-helix repeat protein
MDGFSRRAFCTLLAAGAAWSSGCTVMSQGSPTDGTAARNESNDANVVVTTRAELEAAFENLSPGDTIRISGENAPYRTTQWLDVDEDGVTVVGPGVQTLVKPADGANVGGIRIGRDSRCHEIDVRAVGYHGNPNGQGANAERLHGIAVRDATNVTIEGCLVRRTCPVQHGNGGSGISVTKNCSDVRIFDTKIDEFGDRGIQLGGERQMVYGNVITNGLDRPIAADLWPSSGTNQTAESASIFGNLLGNSYEGSLVGVARNTPVAENLGNVSIVGNVGFGSHKSFCHVRGPKELRNVSIQNNVSVQNTDDLQTDQTKQFAGIAVDIDAGQNFALKNNELYGYSGHGIHVNSDVSDVTIQHNGVFDSGLSGIRLVGGNGGLVDGNLVTGTEEAGIRLKRATNVAVRGNYVRQVGTAGIATGGSKPGAGQDVADNYVAANDQQSGESFPAILVRDSGVRVRGNAIRQNGGPAIAEPDGVQGNVYRDNWADGEDPWRIASPDSRVRDHVPPTDVHRGVSADSGSDAVRVEFDRAYARRPTLSFGRVGGAVRKISFETDGDGNYVGAEISVGREGATFDVAVDEL